MKKVKHIASDNHMLHRSNYSDQADSVMQNKPIRTRKFLGKMPKAGQKLTSF